MKKRLYAAVIAAAVFSTSVVPAQLLPVETVQAATNNNNAAGTEDTTTNGNVTAGGFVFYIADNGTDATITGYNGTAKDVTIPTKIKYTPPEASTSARIRAAAADDGNTITYNVTSIAANAFSGKLGIESVTMQGGMDSDGNQFGVTTIGERAFFGCQHLSKLTIAPTTSSIGNNAFSDCVALNTITVTDGNKNYTVIDNALYSYSVASGTGGYTLVQYPLGSTATEYTVPSTISTTLTGIGAGAFWGAPYLETVTLPSTVKTIGANAFAECKFLASIDIPRGVTSIGQSAFEGCTNLLSVSIPEGVGIIASSTFKDCEALEAVTLPETTTVINAEAFYNCKQLKEVIVPGNVTTIGDRAFANCTSLQQITIPVRTTAFGAGVFAGTTTTVRCHSGSRAHTYATQSSLIVERTHTVGFYADSAYTNLISSQEVIDGGNAVPPELESRNGYQYTWSGSYLNVTSDVKVYVVWNRYYTVTFVDDYNDRSVSQEVIAGAYATVPSWSMSGYTLYWDIAVANPVNSSYTAHAIWRSDATGYEIGQTTVRPEKKGTNLTKGNNKYQVTSADAENPTVKFTGLVNENVTSAAITKTVTIGGVTYTVTAIASKAVRNNRKLQSVTIGSAIETIGAQAFYGCTSLRRIRINSRRLKTISSKAFNNIRAGAKFYCYASKVSVYRTRLKKSGMKSPKVSRL